MLLVVGFLLGLVLRWPYSIAATSFLLSGLPIVSVIEMFEDPTSHNLWPLEFMIYAGLSLVSLFGMSAAMLVKRLFKATSLQ
jgi:hypothetical protein